MTRDSLGVHALCPTRWTVFAEFMVSIARNYFILQELWDHVTESVTDIETVAHIGSVVDQMQKFELVFGLVLGENLLKQSNPLGEVFSI